jgi:hypothetical protein
MSKNDCDIIINNVEDVFTDLGDCFESVFDERKTKGNVIKNIFRFGGSLTKLAFNTTSCVVKNAPKAVVAIADTKREIINAVEDEWNDYQKEQKMKALEDKITQLKLKA